MMFTVRLVLFILLATQSSAFGAILNECTDSSQSVKIVCNLAWEDSCRKVSTRQTPFCKASISRAMATLDGEGNEVVSVVLRQNDFAVAADVLSERLSNETFHSLASVPNAPDKITKTKSGKTSKRDVIEVPSEVISKAQAILKKLDDYPLDELAQGEARAIVRGCEKSKSSTEMYICSGFFVPSVVRLNCVNNGACLPLSWGSAGVPNGESAWWRWQTYSQLSDVSIAGIARPWVTTPEVAKICGGKATDHLGKLDNNKFALCMSKEMGGKSAKQAIKCYSKWSASPANFAACLSDVSIGPDVIKEIDCVLHGGSLDTACAKSLGISAKTIAECKTKTGGDNSRYSACLVAAPQTLTLAGDCALKAGGDATLLSHCLKGVANIMASTKVQAVQQCADALLSSKKAEGTDLQIKLLECGGEAAKGTIRAFKKNRVLMACVNDPQENTGKKVKCLEDAGVKLPPQAALTACLATAHTGLDAAECGGLKGARAIKDAQTCLDSSQGNATRQALCIGAQAGLPPDQARLISCASSADSYAAGAACIAGPALGKDAARAVQCAADAQGSPAGTAICIAGPSMNAELRIAAECLASTGGEPMSFTSCAGGRLAVKELQQCISGGFKSENGCFGENNEVVKYFNAQEKVFRGVMKIAGLESAYDNVLNDIKSGKLGENNDARRVFETINRVTLQEPAKAAQAIVREAEQAGKTIIGGVASVQAEVEKASAALTSAIQQALPIVPSVIGGGLKTDLPGGGSATVGLGNVDVKVGDAQVSAGPTHAQVKVGNTGATVDPGKGKVSVSVGGVCIGFGCG